MDLTAHVPKDILDLLPAFLPNRRGDVGRLESALAEGDWVQLQHLAERLYAVGNPYGFRQITTFGRLMREACAEQNKLALKDLISDYAEYLAKVTVLEVDAPLPRQVLSVEAREALLANPPSTRKASPQGGARRNADGVGTASQN